MISRTFTVPIIAYREFTRNYNFLHENMLEYIIIAYREFTRNYNGSKVSSHLACIIAYREFTRNYNLTDCLSCN